MRFIASLVPALFLLSGCSGSTTTRVQDVLQLRTTAEDDPLAAQFEDVEGNRVRLGDVIVGDQMMSSIFMKQGDDGRFDVNIFLTEYGAGKWRRLIKSGNRDVALVIKGKVTSRFEPKAAINKQGTHIVIPGIADTQEQADRLQEIFDKKRSIL